MRELRFAIAAGLIAAVLSWPGSEVEGQSPLAPPCPNGSYTVAVNGVTGPNCVSLHNRTYTMQQWPTFPNTYRQSGAFGCQQGTLHASLVISKNGPACLYFNSPPPAFKCDASYYCTSFNCGSGGTFTLKLQGGPGNWPATLTVTP